MTVLHVDTRVETLRIVRHLDEGLVGDVYEVFDEELREPFALKVLKREFVDEMGFSDRFLRECQVISQLEGDAVNGLDLFGVTRWKHWLRYDYFEGFEVGDKTVRTLMDYLQVHPTGMDEEEVVFLTGQLLQALAQAHGIGLLHRNLKPSNVLLRRGEDDRLGVKIADFGLVRVVGEEVFRKLWQSGADESETSNLPENEEERNDEDSEAPTSAEETRLFRGPEERAGQEAEEAGDLYAVACMVHWALTGEPLPEDRDLRLPADLNSGWRTWLLQGTEPNPSERFADARDALSQLPQAGTSLRYAEMPFEREGQHVAGRSSPYREGVERSTDGAESNLRGANRTKQAFKPWRTFFLVIAGMIAVFYGMWQLYRNAYHSPFTIYKCDYAGFDDAYKLGFGFIEGGVEWAGWHQGERRSSSGQWTFSDDGHYRLRISLLRKRLPESDENSPAFRAVDVMFKKQNSLDDRAKEKRYKRWVDVLEYQPKMNRFLLVKRVLSDDEEYFPGRDKEGRIRLYDKEHEAVEPVEIHFIPFTPPDSTK
ncbi:MAG: hypothetical protein CMJ96_02225 [Planctomycetes bacterium]|nr:hypothetical protein [Planctomycetota bacterium]